jgi:putative hydrolase of the HAD superfamily
MIKVVAWDFDGVLNRSWAEGADTWSRDFQRATGQSLQSYYEHVFAESFHRVITGHEDVRDRVTNWVNKTGAAMSAEEILAWWFAKDARPDHETLALMTDLTARGVRQVIATNNEARRTRYITEDMGFGARVERVFASGHIGVMKPDAAFFAHITDALAIAPADILLIDDREANVLAARKCGWHAFHFTKETRQTLPNVLSAVRSG